jgi:ankyrin repeat protein
VHAQDKRGKTHLHLAVVGRHVKTVKLLLESGAAEVAAAAMAALFITDEEDQTQAPPSKQGCSNKAQKHHMNPRKEYPEELDTGYRGHDEALSSSVASRSGRRDSAGGRDDMSRGTALQSEPERDIHAHGGEEKGSLVFDNDGGQSHNKSEGSIGGSVKQVEACSVECK